MRTHIKNILVFSHNMFVMQVASGKFSIATGEAEVTRLKERIRQVKAEICDNFRQIVHVR